MEDTNQKNGRTHLALGEIFSFGTLPAIRAAQLDPVESLRYE